MQLIHSTHTHLIASQTRMQMLPQSPQDRGVKINERNSYTHTYLTASQTHMHVLPQSPQDGGIDGGLRLGKQAELEGLLAQRDAHKRQEREKKITAKYHKVSEV